MKNFALIGVAGFVAPRHLKAIRDTGNNLVAALDKSDSVGILDAYFPGADFFTEFERFDRHLEKLRRQGKRIDYVSVCSPNYLHDAHVRFALRHGADVVCEKPLVLNPWNLDALSEIEKESGKRVYTILQLRLHPAIIQLKQKIESSPKGKRHRIKLDFITTRGPWYHHSWKGDASKSGGILMNIGVHFFDMLLWIFGDKREAVILEMGDQTASGTLTLERADVQWKLSISESELPDSCKRQSKKTYRSLQIEGEEIEFSEGFADLHTECYKKIIEGRGFGIEDARKSIDVVHALRNHNEN